MSRKKTQNVITGIAVAIATILAWLSGCYVMHIVYDSIVASIIFGTVWSIIVFCESRFSYISLKSDGRIEISKEEIKSNLWQIIAATLVALLVTIPLELKLYADEIVTTISKSDLGMQVRALWALFSTHWITMIAIGLVVIAIYQIPIFVRMMSENELY